MPELTDEQGAKLAELEFPVRARALVSLVVEPATVMIVGYNKDGSPRFQRKSRETKAGEVFDIKDARVYRALLLDGDFFVSVLDEFGNEIELGADGFPLEA